MIVVLTRCPHCGYAADRTAAIGARPATPKPGDASMCIGCGGIAIFARDLAGLRLRLPDADEQAVLESNPTIARAREAWAATSQARARGASR